MPAMITKQSNLHSQSSSSPSPFTSPIPRNTSINITVVVVPTVIGAVLILVAIQIIYIKYRRRKSELERQSTNEVTVELPAATGLATVEEGANKRVASPGGSDASMVYIDNSMLSGYRETLTTEAGSFKIRMDGNETYQVPYFQRLKLMRRAGEMPHRKSLVLDEEVLPDASSSKVVTKPLPKKNSGKASKKPRSLKLGSIKGLLRSDSTADSI